VLGGDKSSGAVHIIDQMIECPTMLVLGSEGFGLRNTVRHVCNGFVSISPAVPNHLLRNVDSLNVSVAAGILLHQLISNQWNYSENF
jgi:21S rRNA (GM2251-2'-O)-methyltransferase